MEPDKLSSVVRTGDKLYVFGPLTHERMWLEPRKWWQFWLPRYVEKVVSWETWPGDK